MGLGGYRVRRLRAGRHAADRACRIGRGGAGAADLAMRRLAYDRHENQIDEGRSHHAARRPTSKVEPHFECTRRPSLAPDARRFRRRCRCGAQLCDRQRLIGRAVEENGLDFKSRIDDHPMKPADLGFPAHPAPAPAHPRRQGRIGYPEWCPAGSDAQGAGTDQARPRCRADQRTVALELGARHEILAPAGPPELRIT